MYWYTYIPSSNVLHRRVIDTSYLFQLLNESPSSAPSLRDISETYLGTKMGVIHDSVEDAKSSMLAVLKILANGLPAPISRGSTYGGNDSALSLLVHRIPSNCTAENLTQMFVTNAFIVPSKILSINYGADKNTNNGKATVVFETVQHADLAFETLSGPNRADKSNRPQKRVYLKGGGYLCVRKY